MKAFWVHGGKGPHFLDPHQHKEVNGQQLHTLAPSLWGERCPNFEKWQQIKHSRKALNPSHPTYGHAASYCKQQNSVNNLYVSSHNLKCK